MPTYTVMLYSFVPKEAAELVMSAVQFPSLSNSQLFQSQNVALMSLLISESALDGHTHGRIELA